MWKYFFYPENKKARWLFSVWCSIYIVAFYRILEPSKSATFNYNYPIYYDVIAMFLFMITIAFMTLTIPKIFKQYFDINNWSFKKFNLWFLILVSSAAITAYIFDYFAHDLSRINNQWQIYFIDFQFSIDLFVAFPVYILFLIENKNWHYIPDIENTAILNTAAPLVSPSVTFIDQNNKSFVLAIEQIFYITSSGNYINIFYKTTPEQVTNVSLRCTLKEIEEQSESYPDLFRCHKAYIVNRQKIVDVKGNARGYFLLLKDCNEIIPVSRSKNDFLKEHLIGKL